MQYEREKATHARAVKEYQRDRYALGDTQPHIDRRPPSHAHERVSQLRATLAPARMSVQGCDDIASWGEERSSRHFKSQVMPRAPSTLSSKFLSHI
jgi:hypothetical protein